jgi:Zn-dependent M28 family amino/carboxypeptidase
MRYPFAATLFTLVLLAACSRANSTATATPAQPENQTAAQQPSLPSAANVEPIARINGERVMQSTREIVALGPRWLNNPAHHKVEQYILDHLKGIDVEQDKFVQQTSEGPFPMNNIIAKFPGTKDGIIVLASHYETNYWLRDTSFVGADDGASTSALLLEIANKLRARKLDGYSVWLVWDDGEESMKQQWNTEDALFGTRHLAQKWQQDGTAKKIKALMVLDMIGYKDLDILREEHSAPWLEDLLYQAASKFGYQSHFFNQRASVEDDHLPFAKVGIPVADIIIGPYGYNDSYHHTTEDTIDKLSARSLQIVGDTVMQTIAMLNQR